MKVVILSGAVIENNLSVVFGDILPIELPLSNKQLLSHQLDSLPSGIDFEIYVTIPDNYQIELPKRVKRINTARGNSLLDSINTVSRFFNSDDHIFIYYGDSLFIDLENLDFKSNTIFAQRPSLNYNWGSSNNDGMVPAGGFVIDNRILSSTLLNSYSFDEFYQNLYNDNQVDYFYDFKWLDFGHILTYYNSRIRFLESRHFNSLDYSEGFIIKKSPDFYKMWCEFNWLQKAKELIPLNIPYTTGFNINNSVASYKLEYINHPTLSDLFVFGKHSLSFYIQILYKIKETLFIFKSKQIEEVHKNENVNFLVEKLKSRSDEILKIAVKLGHNRIIISKLIELNIEYFNNKETVMSNMHGDMCFSNILFDISNFEPILIDPRGNISGLGYSLIGPDDYDLYKLSQSFIFGYDYLIANKVDKEFFSVEMIRSRLETFCNIFQCNKNDIIMGSKNLFLTMIPLHSDSSIRQSLFLNILLKIDEL